MAKQKTRLRFPNIILLLCGLILIIFLFDFLWRNVISPTVPGDIANIVTADGTFASTNSSNEDLDIATEPTSDDNTENASDTTEKETHQDIPSQTITLQRSQINNGPLILVSGTCPFLGSTSFVDFSSNTNSNVKPRDTSLKINPDMMQPLSDLFDGFCADNGYVNLQIYSTTELYYGTSSLYTTELSERNTGYTFDIGLITSTGDIAPYISKRNEWMFSNCWKYGFIVRYNDTKTGTTGVGFMPHHFRYVGLPHSLIMNEKDMCLEEYLQYLTNYTIDSPLTYSVDSKEYKIFYVPANVSGDTEVAIPKDAVYTVSGNNTDGFIITMESANDQSQSNSDNTSTKTEAPTDSTSNELTTETEITSDTLIG